MGDQVAAIAAGKCCTASAGSCILWSNISSNWNYSWYNDLVYGILKMDDDQKANTLTIEQFDALAMEYATRFLDEIARHGAELAESIGSLTEKGKQANLPPHLIQASLVNVSKYVIQRWDEMDTQASSNG